MKAKIEQSRKYGPTITLNPDAQYPFRFGIEKAKLIVAQADEIKAFVARFAQPEGRAIDYPCTDAGYEDSCAQAVNS